MPSGLRSVRAALGRTPLGPPYRRLRSSLRRRSWAQKLNATYDRDLVRVLQQVLVEDSVCVDVGAHAGAILTHMVRLAPNGNHLAVEPLPAFAEQLREAFPGVDVQQCALAATSGSSTFSAVTSNPAYSGLRRRPYDRPDEQVEEITVQIERLDDLVGKHRPVRLLKVDVEGGEVGVLQGATRLLTEDRPFVAFEFGAAAARAYGSRAEDAYAILNDAGLRVTTLARWLSREPAFTREEFLAATSRDFFFLAYPQ